MSRKKKVQNLIDNETPSEKSNTLDKTSMTPEPIHTETSSDEVVSENKGSDKSTIIIISCVLGAILLFGAIGYGLYKYDSNQQAELQQQKDNLWDDCLNDFDCFGKSVNQSIMYYRQSMIPGNFSCGLIVIYGYKDQQFPNCENSTDRKSCYINFCGYMERFNSDTQDLVSKELITGAHVYEYTTLKFNEDLNSEFYSNEENFRIAKCIVEGRKADNESTIEKIEASCK